MPRVLWSGHVSNNEVYGTVGTEKELLKTNKLGKICQEELNFEWDFEVSVVI